MRGKLTEGSNLVLINGIKAPRIPHRNLRKGMNILIIWNTRNDVESDDIRQQWSYMLMPKISPAAPPTSDKKEVVGYVGTSRSVVSVSSRYQI